MLTAVAGREEARAMREGAREDSKRRSATGEAAELAVVHWLKEHGYSIVATNLRLGRYEIDIVARCGPVVAVVEVRYRGPGAWTTGFGSIDSAKRMRIRRAGERLWSRRYRFDESVERLRFDAASVRFVEGRAEVSYVIAAF